jgi:flavin reductase (DIM6/NTAB) family NADH-FMN oxidoreductase RutF
VDDGFDAVAGALDTAMVVVTAAAGEERDGCLVGFHSQAGIHPRRYVVWLSVANRTYRLAKGATHLAVHALGADDHALAARFGAQTGDDPEVDKLADLEWMEGPDGVPVLGALPVRFVGRVLATLEVPDGDHVGFVLRPVAAPEAREALASAQDAARARRPLRLGEVQDLSAGHDA